MGINEKAWHVGFKWTIGDEDNPTGAIALDDASDALHICEIKDVGTDWDVSTTTHPTLYIHSASDPATDYIRIYHNGTNGFIDCDGTAIFTMTATTLAIAGEITVTGGVTWTGASNVTLTDPTTGDDAFYGLINASAGWTSGNMVGLRGNVAISGTDNFVSATGVWAGLDFATSTGSGSGLTCAINAEVTSDNATAPNAIVYLQSLPNGSTANFANVPFIAFTEYAPSGTGSGLLFECGHQAAGSNRNVTTGASGIFNLSTLRIKVNGTVFYLPLSSATNTFTYAGATTLTSTLTVGANTAGKDVTVYGETTNGANMLWDASNDYLVFAGGARLEVGTKAVPIVLDSFSGADDIHIAMFSGNHTTAMASGECARNIWSRMKVSKTQDQNVSIYGACLQLRVNTAEAVELSAGLYSGAWLYYEASDDAANLTISGGEHCAAAATVELSSNQLCTGGSIYGIKINSAVNDSVDVTSHLTSFSALYINGGSGKNDWTIGIEITDCTTALSVDAPITSTSTIGVTVAALTAGDAYSGIRSVVTCAAPNNAYGASGYFQADISGTQASQNHFYGFGSWVNIAASAIGGGASTYLCAQDNGIYAGSPGEWANTLVVFGMRMECVGVDADTKRFPFSINTGGVTGLTALFDVNSLDEMSRITSATEQSEYVPIFRTSAGDMRYIRLYTA